MTESSRAVFLSYASQDAEAAGRICDALRTAGIEVWFDRSELRGGDAWDRSIRKEIKTCVLFIPLISRNTHERDEWYFRLEWKLAVDRSRLMTGNKAFLLPVVMLDPRARPSVSSALYLRGDLILDEWRTGTAAWALLRRSVIRCDLNAIMRGALPRLLSGMTATVVHHCRD